MRSIVAIYSLENSRIGGMKYELLEDRNCLLVDAAFRTAEELHEYVEAAMGDGYTITQDAQDYLDSLVVSPHADLNGADLAGLDMTGADLAEASLNMANLTNANLTNANLTNANLSGANLVGSDLSGANLKGASLKGATLICADLTDADLRWAVMPRPNQTVEGCWEGLDGTHYGDPIDVPWQVRGSVRLVPCDGEGPAHGRR